MNKRAANILLLLIESNTKKNITNLSNKYKVSKRSIYNDLEEIEEFLVQNNYQIFQRSGGKCYVDIDKLEKDELLALTKMVRSQISEIKQYDPNIRISYEIFLILKSVVTTTEDLANELGLSKSTIKSDLNAIRNKIFPFNLELVTERFKGITIVGSEIEKRNLLIEIILNDYKANKIDDIDRFYLKYIDQDLLDGVQEVIDNVAGSLEIQYVEKHYIFILISSFVSLKRAFEGRLIGNGKHESLKVITHDNFFKVVSGCIIKTFDESKSLYSSKAVFNIEVSYIVSRIQVASYHGTGDTIYDKWLDLQFIVNRLIKNVESSTDMIDSNDSRLHEEIIQHLRPTINRLEEDISFKNPLKNEIYENYPGLSKIIKENINIIENFYNIKFTEDELSYIVLLFASSFERNKKYLKIKPSVVIVCTEGISTSSILKSQLEQQFDINILAIYSKSKFLEVISNPEKINFDFVISTVSLDLDSSFYLKVKPILDEKDILQLNTYFNFYSPEKTINQIINKIKPYIQITDEENLKRKLNEILGAEENATHENKRGILMLKDVINEDLIATQQKVDNAFGAVDLAGKLLKENGLINDNYISAMKDNLKENGPYFVIAPRIAMPHARPEEGSEGVGISIVTLESPVKFGHPTNDPVSLIIGLCAIDHQTHLNALAELMDILSDDEKLNNIIKSKNKKDILNILKEG